MSDQVGEALSEQERVLTAAAGNLKHQPNFRQHSGEHLDDDMPVAQGCGVAEARHKSKRSVEDGAMPLTRSK